MKRKRVVPSGVKPVKRRLATGEVKTYWYHRATGKPLTHDPATAEGLLEVAALDAKAKRAEAVHGLPGGSFAALWAAYVQSPEWTGLKPRTRDDYQRVRDWLGAGAERAIVKLMTTGEVIALRDRAFRQRGRRFANYVVQVVRLVLEWGRLRGWRDDNPAMGVKLIRKPKGEGHLNRAWTEAEVEAFARAAPAQLLVPFALGLFAGMRQGDALRCTWGAFDGSVLRWTASKNDEPCTAPVTGVFLAVLTGARERAREARATAERAGRKRPLPLHIALTSRDTPWTESGYRASFFKLVRELEGAGQLAAGCTFQGLRHSIATFARDGEETEFRIASAIGDRSTSMAAVYGRDADRQRAQVAVLGDVQARFKNADWKTQVENASGRSPRR